MGKGKKTKKSKRSEKEVFSENENDNHSDIATVTRKRAMPKSVVTDCSKGNKRHKSSRLVNDSESDQFDSVDCRSADQVQFEEDDNIVQISVFNDRNEFPSDEEFSEESEEEGELKDDQQSVGNTDTGPSTSRATEHRVIKKSRRQSIEDQVEKLSSTVEAMQQLMKEKGILDEFNKKQDRRDKAKSSRSGEMGESLSVTTIYQEAVPQQKQQF